MVLTLVLLPAVAGMMEQGDVGFATLAVDMGITIGKVIAFIAIMMLVVAVWCRGLWHAARQPVLASCLPCRCWRWR